MLRRKQINLITYAPASLTLPHMGHLGQLLGRDVPAYSVNWNQPFKVYHIFTHPTFYSPDVNAPLGDAVYIVGAAVNTDLENIHTYIQLHYTGYHLNNHT